jgi:uncharacterized protein YgiM (DUF1202 family)
MEEYNPKKRLILYKVLIAVQILLLAFSLHAVLSSTPKATANTTSKPAGEVFLQTTATVTSKVLILYAERSPKSSNLKTLKKGDVIIVTGKGANGWTPVKSGNATGWVLSSSIAEKAKEKKEVNLLEEWDEAIRRQQTR